MDEIETTLDEIINKIASTHNPEKITISGSYAYDRPIEESDIDILAIMETSKREIERMIAVSKSIQDYHKKIDFDILVKTPAEVEDRLKVGDPFIGEIVSKERVRICTMR